MGSPLMSLNGRWGGKLRNQPLDIVSGDDLILEVTVLQPDGTAKNLSGATVKWELSRRPGTAAKITKTATITGASTGVFQVAVDSTEDLSGDYYHEAEVIDSVGFVCTVMRGSVLIARDTVNAG